MSRGRPAFQACPPTGHNLLLPSLPSLGKGGGGTNLRHPSSARYTYGELDKNTARIRVSRGGMEFNCRGGVGGVGGWGSIGVGRFCS